MIGDQQKLTQVSLTRAVRNGSKEVHFGIRRELLERLAVTTEVGEALIPGAGCWRRASRWPIIFRFWLLVVGVSAELKNVELAKTQVFEDLPERVRLSFGPPTAE